MHSSTECLVDPELEYNFGISGSTRAFRGKVLEPTVLLLFFAIDLSGTIIQNQIIFQACTEVFGYNTSDCELLGTENAKNQTMKIETEIQPYVANIFMVRSIIDGVIPVVGALYIGGWSDKYGRKPIILIGLIGHCSLYVLCATLAYASTVFSINPWSYIAITLPKAILSADCAFKCAAFAYIADVTDDATRILRMSVYEAFLYFGIITGYLASSSILRATNAYTVFAISGGIIFLAMVLVWIGLEESVQPNEIDESHELSIVELFKWPFQRRSRNDRAVLWLIIATLVLNIFVVGGSANVFFLFVRERFDWTVKEYTQFQAAEIALQILGNTIFVIFLQKILKLSAISITLLAYGSYVIDAVIKGTSQHSWELYVAAATGMLKASPGPMCRSIMSSFIPANEIGKVFSFISATQSLTPLLSAPFYTELYKRTLEYDTGLFNIFSAGFYTICFVFMTIVFAIFKCYKYRGSRDFSDD